MSNGEWPLSAENERLKREWDMYSVRSYAFKQGKVEGLAEGRAEWLAEFERGKAEANLIIAQKMLEAGIDKALIKKITGVEYTNDY